MKNTVEFEFDVTFDDPRTAEMYQLADLDGLQVSLERDALMSAVESYDLATKNPRFAGITIIPKNVLARRNGAVIVIDNIRPPLPSELVSAKIELTKDGLSSCVTLYRTDVHLSAIPLAIVRAALT